MEQIMAEVEEELNQLEEELNNVEEEQLDEENGEEGIDLSTSLCQKKKF